MSDVPPLHPTPTPLWNLRAVICFHFTISALVLLPSPVTLSVLSSFFLLPAGWSLLLNFFQKILQYFSLRDRLFCMAPVQRLGEVSWSVVCAACCHAAIWHGYLCCCKILRISYKDHVTNEEVRAKIQQAIGPREDHLTIVKRRKLQWYGHVSRSLGLAKTILQGTVKGERKQGRQRKRREDDIREWKGQEFAKSHRAVENREKWRNLIAKSSVVPQQPSRGQMMMMMTISCYAFTYYF